MLNDFIDFIKLENLFNSKHKILLGVSGGVDSVVMVDLFFKSGLDFGIAHCNFGLRGKESDEDNSFVELLAQKNHVLFYSKKFDTLTYANNQSISIQMAARDLRINWFEEVILSHGYNYYATAHHLDDQIETILNNFFRGTGISGLHGILPKRNKLIHPMLFCFRKQIEEYADKHQLRYREDRTNKKTEYIRNQIRHQLIPVIKKIYPNYQKTISENIQRIHQVETIYRNHIQKKVEELIVKNKEYVRIPIKKLFNLQPVEMYLYELIKPYGFNYANAADILNSINASSGKYFLSDTHKITKDRTDLIIEERKKEVPWEYLIEKEEIQVSDPVNLKMKNEKYTTNYKISKKSNIAYLDTEKLKYPLKLRKWYKGDYFYPLGMNQKKLISDFFIDNKVSVPDKEKTWLLVSEKQIVWVIGHRIDNRYKITANTKTILNIEYIDKTGKL